MDTYHTIIMNMDKYTVEFVGATGRKLVQKPDTKRLGLTFGLLKAGGWHGVQIGALVIFRKVETAVVKDKKVA